MFNLFPETFTPGERKRTEWRKRARSMLYAIPAPFRGSEVPAWMKQTPLLPALTNRTTPFLVQTPGLRLGFGDGRALYIRSTAQGITLRCGLIWPPGWSDSTIAALRSTVEKWGQTDVDWSDLGAIPSAHTRLGLSSSHPTTTLWADSAVGMASIKSPLWHISVGWTLGGPIHIGCMGVGAQKPNLIWQPKHRPKISEVVGETQPRRMDLFERFWPILVPIANRRNRHKEPIWIGM